MDFYSVFKKLAFTLDAEQTHNLTLNLLSKALWLVDFFDPIKKDVKLQLSCGELKWDFPVGLAAGFDKNAQCIELFHRLGFGSIEVGTITKEAQRGNVKPRVFRHPDIRSLQNSMGFPNDGAEKIYTHIKKAFKTNDSLNIGINIGKNKSTTPTETPSEYAFLYKKFAPLGKYIAINISSPNTEGLRAFQQKEKLVPILDAVKAEYQLYPKPIFIKISPDLNQDECKLICELAKEYQLAGVIATNTTSDHQFGAGGLSGVYLQEKARSIRGLACQYLKEDPALQVIGVGGISNYADIKEFWKQGGGFTQIYTSLIYQGPRVLQNINQDIIADIEKYQFKNLQEMHTEITRVD